MKRKVVHTDRVPAGRARISQAIIHGDVVYVSGMVARVPATGKVPPGGAGPQTRQVLKNVESVLKAAGSDMRHVLKMSCFLSDMDDFPAFNTEWETFFPKEPPARICVQARLGPSFVVEIDAIAALPPRRSTKTKKSAR
ncbi:MAG: RidA family protein [Alphaproteobacteria bacterium]|nr:RidA family protein [Alphaproteobacteria bacterium]